MKVTTFYLPDCAEALLHETIMATVFDSRVVTTMCLNAPTVARLREDHESDVEYASRAWSGLLPGSNHGTLSVRMEYGWTESEIRQIVHLLRLAKRDCRTLGETPGILEGTREQLDRQAERLHSLSRQWVGPLLEGR